jgi:hypothetical protein
LRTSFGIVSPRRLICIEPERSCSVRKMSFLLILRSSMTRPATATPSVSSGSSRASASECVRFHRSG